MEWKGDVLSESWTILDVDSSTRFKEATSSPHIYADYRLGRCEGIRGRNYQTAILFVLSAVTSGTSITQHGMLRLAVIRSPNRRCSSRREVSYLCNTLLRKNIKSIDRHTDYKRSRTGRNIALTMDIVHIVAGKHAARRESALVHHHPSQSSIPVISRL